MSSIDSNSFVYPHKGNVLHSIGRALENRCFPNRNSRFLCKETLRLIEHLEAACNAVKDIPSERKAWYATYDQEGKVVQAQLPEYAWQEAPEDYLVADEISNEHAVAERIQYRFAAQQAIWEKQKNQFSFFISEKVQGKDQLHTRSFVVDLSSGEVISQAFEVVDVIINKPVLFSVSHSELLHGSNARLNVRLEAFAHTMIYRAQAMHDEHEQSTLFVRFVECLAEQSNHFNASLLNADAFLDAIEQVLTEHVELKKCKDISRVQKELMKTGANVPHLLRSMILSEYIRHYTNIHSLSGDSYTYNYGQPQWLQVHDMEFGLKLHNVFGERLEELIYDERFGMPLKSGYSSEEVLLQLKALSFAEMLTLPQRDFQMSVQIVSSDFPQVIFDLSIESAQEAEITVRALKEFLQKIRLSLQAIGLNPEEVVTFLSANGSSASLSEYEKAVQSLEYGIQSDRHQEAIEESFAVLPITLEEVRGQSNDTIVYCLTSSLHSEKLNGKLDALSEDCCRPLVRTPNLNTAQHQCVDLLLKHHYDALFFKGYGDSEGGLHVLIRQEGDMLVVVSGNTLLYERQIAHEILRIARSRHITSLTLPIGEGSNLRSLYKEIFGSMEELGLSSPYAGRFLLV